MRQKLNENKNAQLILIAVLILGGGLLFMTRMKGSSSSSSSSAPAAAAPAAPTAAPTGTSTDSSASLTASASVPAPPLPAPLVAAHRHGDTVVLLVVKPGGIDDRMVVQASSTLLGEPGVALFVVPVDNLARYAAITQGVGLDRTPALIVMRPGDSTSAQASIQYGFQTPESIVQAVRDARYRGPTLTYAPN
jgi:hypothetical protein